MAEELALEERLGNGRARDVQEGAGRARTAEMDRLRGQVLPRPALARQEDGRRRARGDLPEKGLHAPHRRGLTHDPVEGVRRRLARAQSPHLASQARRLERLLDEKDHLLELDGLVDVVIRAQLDRLDRARHARIGGEEDDDDVRIQLLDPRDERDPVRVGQAEVEDHEVDPVAAPLEPFRAVLGLQDLVAGRLQPLAERPADQLFVIDDEDPDRRHARILDGGSSQPYADLSSSPTRRTIRSKSNGFVTKCAAPRAAARSAEPGESYAVMRMTGQSG